MPIRPPMDPEIAARRPTHVARYEGLRTSDLYPFLAGLSRDELRDLLRHADAAGDDAGFRASVVQAELSLREAREERSEPSVAGGGAAARAARAFSRAHEAAG